ncbi:putative transporter [Trachipleistophora hominis]|uniref:Putative transporter n=1 Tax=Trachipleistophora hominis TaxID=72359 RepID=L7JXX0_TRAHO|nr:putative transporter [Trachipleistophora hominis]
MDNLVIYAQTPFYLEMTLLYDLKTTFTSFIRTYMAIVPCFFRWSTGSILDRLKVLTILIVFTFLRSLNCSRMYHSLKVQSLVRLYVLFNVLELAEKLIGTLVNDIAKAIEERMEGTQEQEHTVLEDESVVLGKSNVRLGSEKSSNNKNVVLGKRNGSESEHEGINSGDDVNAVSERDKRTENESMTDRGSDVSLDDKVGVPSSNSQSMIANAVLMAVLTTFFIISTAIHTLVLYFQYLIIQLSLNSSSSVLYSLVISNQFLELKGNVTKKGDKAMLFSLVDHDGTKRFSLLIFVVIAFLSVCVESEKLTFTKFILPIIVVLLFKVLVDWIKHIFFCRYNNLNLSFYMCYKKEYVKGNNFVGLHILFMWMLYELTRMGYFSFLACFLACVHFVGLFIK